MDNVRVILWAVLASLLWLAATQWQRTYTPVPEVVTETSIRKAAQSTLPAVPSDNSDGVPGVPQGDSPAVVDTTKTVDQPALITVKTDVLDISISMSGGNLVQAYLPRYPLSKDEPDKLVQLLKENDHMKAQVESHTDDIGTHNYNVRLSEMRSQAVIDYLEGQGVHNHRLDPVGLGEEKPLASNDDEEEGRELNRRTEFVIIEL